MEINPGIFKAYDIRGVYNVDFDDEMAYKLGLAYSEMRKKEMPEKEKLQIVVGADMRLSSPALKARLIAGLLDGGVDVVDIGLASTPTYYFAVAHYGYDGGILVSASHNPKEYNGFKLVRSKALPISKDTGMAMLRDMVLNTNGHESERMATNMNVMETDNSESPNPPNPPYQGGRISICPPDKGGRGVLTQRSDVLAEQIKHDLQFADISKIKPFKIVIDPANAMGAQYFDEMFKHLPCEIVRMNWELDGTFPAHEADPFKPENMESLCERVKAEKADLGISTDGDGDRIFFVDDLGEAIDPGITRAILCKIFLRENPGAKICYDIRPGKITEDTIRENGGTPIVTRVGHSLIKEQAIKEQAVFAGESSGHFFLNMDEGCYEVPVIVTLKILEELGNTNSHKLEQIATNIDSTASKKGIRFSEYIQPYKRYFHSSEINSRVESVTGKIAEIKERYADGQQNDLDGITVEYEDWWFNVRGSNTEPLLRLNLEARTRELMEVKRDEVLKVIRNE